MHQYLKIKGVARFFNTSKAIKTFGVHFLCAFTFLSFSPLFGQERVIQRVTAPIVAPIQSVQSALSQPAAPTGTRVNSTLPGLGTLPPPPTVFAGSLELLPDQPTYLPSIYVEGQGYVPLSHPNIQPHIDPELLENPNAHPSIVMVAYQTPPENEPEYRLNTPDDYLNTSKYHLNTPEYRLNDSDIVQTQFISGAGIPSLPDAASLGFRRIEFNPRGDTGVGVSMNLYNPQEPSRGGIVVLTGGINLIIEGITDDTALAMLAGDTVDISADNAVIWTENPGKIQGGASFVESDNLDMEIYLEGNIIYRDGPRVIEASRMYYDAKHKIGYISDGHLFAPIGDISGIEGFVRLRAVTLRQVGDGLFTARNAMFTTSLLGEPTYSLRSQSLRFDRTGKRQLVVAENNYVAIRNVPVFYWPWMATDVENPTFYIKNFSYGSSGRNGHTIKTQWDPFQILNIRRPDGVDGDVNVGWMEKRGVNYGVNFKYDSPFYGIPRNGNFVYWGIHDKGTDHLGGARSDVTFPDSYRYRVHWVHQQQCEFLPSLLGATPWSLRAEVGKTSDRNLLNSHFNSVWHTQENATTAIDLKRQSGNTSLGISAEYALDDHYSNANWLPRLDHYTLGKSLLNDYLTMYGHTRVGLMDYRTAKEPTDPVDEEYFQYLPWEETAHKRTGLVFSSRHELDLPIQAGALKIVPYVLGDLSAWGEDQTGKSVERFYGQGGVRLNLPIWRVNPRVSSRTWYVNGLAHKIDLNAEYMYAQANRGMENLILTDPLDNWSIDDFRRRYLLSNPYFESQGGMPAKFDPRYYALRSGMASNVTAGNMEIADDMQMFRLGMTHRFQTKRGSVGRRRILDWITVSTHVNLYPQSQYNHGQGAGLFDYNALWHVGDRFSLFSEGLYDFFGDGQNLTRLGGVWNRPERGSFSLAVDQFSGVVERTYLSMNIGYTMSEKYSMSYSTSYDLRNGQNVGHNLMFARSGESFRLLVGAVYSEALSEWSFSVGLEPVFLRRSGRGSSTGGTF